MSIALGCDKTNALAQYDDKRKITSVPINLSTTVKREVKTKNLILPHYIPEFPLRSFLLASFPGISAKRKLKLNSIRKHFHVHSMRLLSSFSWTSSITVAYFIRKAPSSKIMSLRTFDAIALINRSIFLNIDYFEMFR
jgi:hypothetical protein